MKRQLLSAAILVAAGVTALGAQVPRTPMGPGSMPVPGGMRARGGAVDDPAQYLLAHTGELNLTDAQVTRLAGIARRSAERRRAFRAQMDSIRPAQGFAGPRPDSAARAQMRQRLEQMRPAMQRLRDQSQTDRRDAIALLTPDQQARAWERIAASGRMQRGGMGRGFRPGRGMPGGRMGMQGPGRFGPRNDGARTDRRPTPKRQPDER
jgi:Spy/CpxP family protein refolding chaperone